MWVYVEHQPRFLGNPNTRLNVALELHTPKHQPKLEGDLMDVRKESEHRRIT